MEEFKLNIIDKITNVIDDNVDIEVIFNNSEKHIATFITLENIKSLMEKYAITGECSNGAYFWASNSIIVKDLEVTNIRNIIKDLIFTGEFEDIFHRAE